MRKEKESKGRAGREGAGVVARSPGQGHMVRAAGARWLKTQPVIQFLFSLRSGFPIEEPNGEGKRS